MARLDGVSAQIAGATPGLREIFPDGTGFQIAKNSLEEMDEFISQPAEGSIAILGQPSDAGFQQMHVRILPARQLRRQAFQETAARIPQTRLKKCGNLFSLLKNALIVQ